MDEEIMADGVLRNVVKPLEVKDPASRKHNLLDEITIEEFDIIKHGAEAGNRFYNEKWLAPA